MKLALACLPILLGSAIAHADGVKPATLDVVCTSEKSTKVVHVVSSEAGGRVEVDGIKVLEARQFFGGTEGGAPYLQAVGNGYNITMSSGAFEEAFYQSTLVEGEAAAYMWLDSTGAVTGVCRGRFSF